MKIDLSGKTALVTASSGGIGFAIAAGLAECHAEVMLNGRSMASVQDARARLQQRFPEARIRAVAADLSSAEGVTALLDQIPSADILVNNAGIYGVRLSRALLPGMVAKQWGRVVFVSSESARNIPEDMIHYGVSKTAQLALARGLAKRVAGSGVTVNSVLPGPTLSDGFATLMQEEAERTGKSVETLADEFVKTQRPGSLIQRIASVEEVANMVVYVCSPQASATSGTALRVDGGLVNDIL